MPVFGFGHHRSQKDYIQRDICPRKSSVCSRAGSAITLAFSCGARSAFKLKEQGYLRSMLSRRQLQGFVRAPSDCNAHRCFSLAETGERGERESKPIQKFQALFATRTAARCCDSDKPRAPSLSSQNAMRANPDAFSCGARSAFSQQ
jgi:hypothetical protein